MASRHRLSLHGLEVDSALPIDGWPAQSAAPVDVVVDMAAKGDLPGPSGERPAALRGGAYPYTVWRTDAGFLLDFPGVAQFAVSRHRVDVVGEGASELRLSPLLGGTVMATVLTARDETVLHASAVAKNGRAIAIVGNSGSGKSTLAALLAASGADLVADDVLRVTSGSTEVHCHGGTSRLRLRANARVLRELLPDWSTAETSDGRLALAPPVAPPPQLTLASIVLPLFDPACPSPQLHRIRGVDAFTRLWAAPRISGWQDPRVLSLFHRDLPALVRLVPVVLARLPRLDFSRESAQALSSLFW